MKKRIGFLIICSIICMVYYYCGHQYKIYDKEEIDDTISYNQKCEEHLQTLVAVDTITSELLVNYMPIASIEFTTCKEKHHPNQMDYVAFCCVAAFTDSNGRPVGSYYAMDRGYNYCLNTDEAITGGIIFYSGPHPSWKFLSSNYEGELSKHPGQAFAQHLIVYNDEIQPLFNKILGRPPQYYRALCEFNDKLCVIENYQRMRYEDFVKELYNLHVRHALYLDMGSYGYEWYYQFLNGEHMEGLVKKGEDNPKASNWLLFYYVN